RMRILFDLLSLGGCGGSLSYPREVLPRLTEYPHEWFVLLRQGYADGDEVRKIIPKGMMLVDASPRTRSPFYRHWYQRHDVPRLAEKLGAHVVYAPGGLTGTRQRKAASFKLVVMFRNMLPFDAREASRYALLHYPFMRLRNVLLKRGL